MAFLDHLAARLVSQGVGVIGTNIFISSRAYIPPGDGPFLTLTETGGLAPTRVHNKNSVATQRPTAQVMVKAVTYAAARTMSVGAYNALDGVFNTNLSGTFYLRIAARQEPTDVGMEDGTSHVLISFNVEVEKLPDGVAG